MDFFDHLNCLKTKNYGVAIQPECSVYVAGLAPACDDGAMQFPSGYLF